MTLGQIRREIEALKRKYAKELTILRLRRQAEEVCDQWERAVNDQQEPPQPHAVVGRWPPPASSSPPTLPCTTT